jgi:hypothetical protein
MTRREQRPLFAPSPLVEALLTFEGPLDEDEPRPVFKRPRR